MNEQNRHIDSQSSRAYDQVLKYTGLFGGVQGITLLLSVIRNKFVAVLLGSVGLALIDLYNHAINFLGNATQLGIPTTAVRKLSELNENDSEDAVQNYVMVMRSWGLLTAIVGFLICMVCSPLVSYLTFRNYEHIWQFMFLSPAVAMSALMGVETAILKAKRQLKKLAMATLYGALATLLITIPFYFLWGMRGIVPALTLSSIAIAACFMGYSFKLYRWKAQPFKKEVLLQGKEMVQLGISYIVAGIVAAAAEMFVRSFIVDHGSLAEEGLYCAGFTVTVSYARFVFVSMDADYFPRLSAVCRNVEKMNLAINRQIEICVLLMAPFLIVFVLFLPFIIHLLFSDKFVEAIPMTLCAMFYMYFKAITTPIAYVSLARGDSMMYLSMESAYYIVFVALLAGGFLLGGLPGCGIALSLSNLFDLVLIGTTYYYKYHFRLNIRALTMSVIQGVLLAIVLIISFHCEELFKYVYGIPVMLLSISISFRFLWRETSLIEKVLEKYRQIIARK